MNFIHINLSHYPGDSPTSQEGGILSSGEQKYDQMLWLRVRVFDNIGSWTDIFINATVDPPPDELVLAQAFGKFQIFVTNGFI